MPDLDELDRQLSRLATRDDFARCGMWCAVAVAVLAVFVFPLFLLGVGWVLDHVLKTQ